MSRGNRHADRGRPELIRNDPESEACFERMKTIIAEELSTRLIMELDPIEIKQEEIAAFSEQIGELAANALLEPFTVRLRNENEPRSSWGGADETEAS